MDYIAYCGVEFHIFVGLGGLVGSLEFVELVQLGGP